eukprot:TRINITY_DN39632_c0_g1_i1.p2 TRINITY_DN39632_c0_g1~~TRINITY_DN39632_c0_g1_i1.p2  ORF type:complete len:252 (+),score=98.52 TRINITY_DN39632_c0_g1_i1:120-875(+)
MFNKGFNFAQATAASAAASGSSPQVSPRTATWSTQRQGAGDKLQALLDSLQAPPPAADTQPPSQDLDNVAEGKVASMMRQAGGTFDQKRTLSYAADVTRMLGKMHAQGKVFGNFNLNDLTLSSTGHCIISSGSLSAPPLPKEWMAPERQTPAMMQSHSSKEGDWWSLGVMMFVMLAGHSPFKRKTPEGTLFAMLWEGADTSGLSGRCEGSVLSLVKGLLEPHPEKRIQSYDEISNHPAFAGTDWNALRAAI